MLTCASTVPEVIAWRLSSLRLSCSARSSVEPRRLVQNGLVLRGRGASTLSSVLPSLSPMAAFGTLPKSKPWGTVNFAIVYFHLKLSHCRIPSRSLVVTGSAGGHGVNGRVGNSDLRWWTFQLKGFAQPAHALEFCTRLKRRAAHIIERASSAQGILHRLSSLITVPVLRTQQHCVSKLCGRHKLTKRGGKNQYHTQTQNHCTA